MFTELKLTENFSILTSMITNIDNSLLVKDFEFNCDVSKETVNYKNSPGIQSRIHIFSKNINDLRNEVLKKIISYFELDENYLIGCDDWVYISDNKNNKTNYHDHLSTGNLRYLRESPQWSVVYYAEVPNNLEGKDGCISFLTKDNEEVSVLPVENQIIMFPTYVLHKPELNKNSTNKRVVYAANITILDRNKKYQKTTKTLV